MKGYRVTFEYADAMSGWKWREQSCFVYARNEYEARKKCVDLYGLGLDCDYRIKEVKGDED